MSQRRMDIFVFSSNRAFSDASFARKPDVIYMDVAGMNGWRQLYISVEDSQCIASVRRCKSSLWVACSVECWMDFE